MNILFVSRGDNYGIPRTVVLNQAYSLQKHVNIKFHTVKEKGCSGYIKATLRLRKYLKENNVDIIHAHYTLSGWVCVLSCPKQPIILSLMGTDAYGEYIGINRISFKSTYLILLTKLIKPFINIFICKSRYIESYVKLKKKSYIIPNGVSLERISYEKDGYHEELGLRKDMKYVLFIGDPKNARKNYILLLKAFEKLNLKELNLVAPYPITHDIVIKYLNSVNVLVVPSLMEGSPNVVKEAMACNCPVVATDVGDIRVLFGNEPGYFITSFEPDDVAEKIKLAIEFSEKYGRTNGRQRIIELGLDSKTVAKRIIRIYEKVLEHKMDGKNKKYCNKTILT